MVSQWHWMLVTQSTEQAILLWTFHCLFMYTMKCCIDLLDILYHSTWYTCGQHLLPYMWATFTFFPSSFLKNCSLIRLCKLCLKFLCADSSKSTLLTSMSSILLFKGTSDVSLKYKMKLNWVLAFGWHDFQSMKPQKWHNDHIKLHSYSFCGWLMLKALVNIVVDRLKKN